MWNKYSRRSIVVILLSLFFSSSLCLAEVSSKASVEEAVQHKWATPIERGGLPNLHKVSEELYRGAQPTSEGIKELKKMGIKTIINLRAFHSDRNEIGEIELDYVHIPMTAWHPQEEDLIRFLKIVTDETRTPVFLHCQHGADRTGMMTAIYRIIVNDWTKEEAIEEMTKGGFGFHKFWRNLIRFVEKLDIEEMKTKAGIKSEDGEIDQHLAPQQSKNKNS